MPSDLGKTTLRSGLAHLSSGPHALATPLTLASAGALSSRPCLGSLLPIPCSRQGQGCSAYHCLSPSHPYLCPRCAWLPLSSSCTWARPSCPICLSPPVPGNPPDSSGSHCSLLPLTLHCTPSGTNRLDSQMAPLVW